MAHIRTWFAHCHFAGAQKPFYVGTVEAETEMTAEPKLKTILREILPFDLPAFTLFTVCPGAIIIQHEGKET